MKLDPHRLMGLSIPNRSAAYHARDTMLYALSIGLAADPSAPGELPFAYEAAQRVAPSFANSLAFDESWLAPGGVDPRRTVHASLALAFHAPLAPSGWVEASSRIIGLSDKGDGRGGLVLQETRLADTAGRALCTSLSTLFVTGAGGFGGPVGTQPVAREFPARPPDFEEDVPTFRNQALMFRLLGDRNPLHADPAAAVAAGFERPILHGACTFGIACATVLRRFCGLEPARLASLEARFVGPLYPGETLRFAFWRNDDSVFFRARAEERDAKVLDGGHASVKAQT